MADINVVTVVAAVMGALFGGGAAGRLVSLATTERLRDTFISKDEANLKYLSREDARSEYFSNESLKLAQQIADAEHDRIHDDIDRLLGAVKEATDLASRAHKLAANTHSQLNDTVVRSLNEITDRIAQLVKSNNEIAHLAATAAVAAVIKELPHG